MKLRARSRPHGESAAEVHEWDVEAETYEAARDEARLAVPESWGTRDAAALGDVVTVGLCSGPHL